MSDASSMFYGWEQWETTGDPTSNFAGDNPPFASRNYTRPPGGPNLLKGYIRSSLPEKYGKGRFHFQYNPNTITRSTQVNQDLLGLAQQTAADIQAMSLAGAGAGFSFSLLLDRQDEVFNSSAPDFYKKNESTSSGHDLALGVGVDIAVLDQIAGIGNVMAALDAVDNQGAGTPRGRGGPVPAIDTDVATDAVSGNQAFMASMLPVRVVFSKNFVVEGFLQQIDVTYTKFSRNMVPTVATVQCGMQAFYIGSARATTWWSGAVADGSLANAVSRRVAGAITDVGTTVTDAVGGFINNVTGSSSSSGQKYGNKTPTPGGVDELVIVNSTGGG